MKRMTAQWVLGVSILSFSCLNTPYHAVAQSAAVSSNADTQIQADIAKALNNKRYKNVTSTVQDGTVTLKGTVDLYADKQDAENKIHHRKNVQSVQNMITVEGPNISDPELRAKLSEKLVFDRVGYGTTAFNAFTIGVHNGVVVLGGTAYAPVDRNSALSLVSNYSGVKGVVNNIVVAPPSPMDDRIRMDEARAIYSAAQLNRYALDPGKPIRISVDSGNVILSGAVDSQSDKDIAGIRANTVSGVFKVTNNLQVAGSRAER